MKVVQVETTNDRYSKYNTVRGDLTEKNGRYVFNTGNIKAPGYITSATKLAGLIDSQFVLKTRHSVYTYEIL